ncbi:hypothetical protein BC833DRAFT_586306, partial [Globomyces pollinis-pini]
MSFQLFNPPKSRSQIVLETKDACRSTSAAISDLLVSVANDSSLGLYHIQDHVHKKVPILQADIVSLHNLPDTHSTHLISSKKTHRF